MAADMLRTCKYCAFAELLQYADGHLSIRCAHPNADTTTTRDVALLGLGPSKTDRRVRIRVFPTKILGGSSVAALSIEPPKNNIP